MPQDDYYALLGVPETATPEEIKRAYRRTLLRHHPDKSFSHHRQQQHPPDIDSDHNTHYFSSGNLHDPTVDNHHHHVRLDAALLKEAYETLMSRELRTEYDILLAHARLQYHHHDLEDEFDDSARRRWNQSYQQSRPAHIVSLDEFDEANDVEEAWEYPCRCGGAFRITEAQMEEDFHLVSCPGCSEVIWVGYEVVEEGEDDEEEEEEDYGEEYPEEDEV